MLGTLDTSRSGSWLSHRQCRRAWRAWLLLAVSAITAAGWLAPSAEAAEHIFVSEDLRVIRDFRSDLRIRRMSKVYFERTKFPLYEGSQALNRTLTDQADSFLRSKFVMVGLNEHPDYIIQIRMEEGKNHATRSASGRPAVGFVMVSLCGYPIKNIGSDC